MNETFLEAKKKVEELLGNDNGDVERLTVDGGEYRLDGLDGDVVESIKQHVHSLPIDCTALSYLTVYGSQICNYSQIDGIDKLCGLHSVSVTVSGGGKTSNNEKIIRPIIKMARSERKLYNRRMKKYAEQLRQWEENKKKGQNTKKPKEPRRIAVLTTGQGNMQGLKKTLAYNTRHNIRRGFLMYDRETSAHWLSLAKFTRTSLLTELAILTGLLDFDYREDLQVENCYIIDDVKWGYLGEIQAKILYDIFKKISEALEQGAFSRYLFWIGNGKQKIKHNYDKVKTDKTTMDGKETFEEKLINTLSLAPKVTLVIKNDGARELYDAYNDYIEEFSDMMEDKNKTADLFIRSFIFHSTHIVLSVAGIVHTLNNAAVYMRDQDTEKDIKEECRWDGDITKEELSFAIRFVAHYQYLMIRFLESNGGNDGLENRDPITKNIKRLTKYLYNQTKKPNTKKEDSYTFTRKTLNQGLNIKSKELQEQIIGQMIREQLAENVDDKNKKFKLTASGREFK